MNLEVKDLSAKLLPILHKAKKYTALAFFLAIFGLYGFLMYRINVLTSMEPSEDAILEQMVKTRTPKIDQQAVDTMLQLEETNVEVKSIFDEARNNPFQE